MAPGPKPSTPEWLLPLGALFLAAALSWAVHPFSIYHRPRAAHLLLLGALLLFAGFARATSSPLAAWNRCRLHLALGCLFALGHRFFFANELAGTLLAFLPLAFALALASPRAWNPDGTSSHTRARLFLAQSVAWTALFAGLVALTLSRAGYLALAPFALWILLASGRRGRQALGLASLLGLGLLFWFGPGGALEFLVFDGKLQQPTLDSWLTGRPHIWSRAIHAWIDAPIVGLGLQVAGLATARFYPYTEFHPRAVYEDVHNFYLQTFLDLGLLGGLAILVLLLAATRRLWRVWNRGAPESLERAMALGLAASLGSSALFGVFDSVSLGTWGSLPLWSLLGLCFALPLSASGGPAEPFRPDLRATGALIVGVGLLVIWLWPTNRATLLAARGLLSDTAHLESAQSVLEELGTSRCRAWWLAGQMAHARGEPGERNASWERLLACTPDFIAMMARVAPREESLAAAAVELQPTSADARFWLARIHFSSGGGNEESIRRYREGLGIRPEDDRAWQELGQQLTAVDSRAAREAFERSCQLRDTNGQGCLPAGMLAERAGDLPAAIRLFRRSRIPGTDTWARTLELRLLEAELPEPATAP